MDILNLAPDIQKYILSMPEAVRRPAITERSLRYITNLVERREQMEAFSALTRCCEV